MEIKNNRQKTSLSFQSGVRAPCYSTTFPGKSINYETGSQAQEETMLFDREIDLFLLNMHDIFNLQKLSLSYYFEHTRGYIKRVFPQGKSRGSRQQKISKQKPFNLVYLISSRHLGSWERNFCLPLQK